MKTFSSARGSGSDILERGERKREKGKESEMRGPCPEGERERERGDEAAYKMRDHEPCCIGNKKIHVDAAQQRECLQLSQSNSLMFKNGTGQLIQDTHGVFHHCVLRWSGIFISASGHVSFSWTPSLLPFPLHGTLFLWSLQVTHGTNLIPHVLARVLIVRISNNGWFHFFALWCWSFSAPLSSHLVALGLFSLCWVPKQVVNVKQRTSLSRCHFLSLLQ